MWSDALRILDENTMKLYVEELEEKLKNVLEERDHIPPVPASFGFCQYGRSADQRV